MENYGMWIFGWALGGVAALLAAALLVWILVAARGIEGEARRALEAARRIKGRTEAIWGLAAGREALDAARGHLETRE